MNTRMFLGVAFVGLVLGGSADAGLIAVDEFGNGIGVLGSITSNDPGPGGLNNVLTYTLPFAGTQGDVTAGVEDALAFGGDVFRFNGNGTLIIYSDNTDLPLAPGDTPSPPGMLYANTVSVQEVGPEGSNSVTYTPMAGQPGYDVSQPTYIFVSDGIVPEPPSLVMGVTAALGGLSCYAQRRRKRAA